MVQEQQADPSQLPTIFDEQGSPVALSLCMASERTSICQVSVPSLKGAGGKGGRGLGVVQGGQRGGVKHGHRDGTGTSGNLSCQAGKSSKRCCSAFTEPMAASYTVHNGVCVSVCPPQLPCLRSNVCFLQESPLECSESHPAACLPSLS